MVRLDADDARGAVGGVGGDRNLPALPGARLQSQGLQYDGEQPGGDLLAGGDNHVVLARIVQQRGFANPAHELVGGARHCGDDDRDMVACVHLALHMARDVADAFDGGHGRAAELHHNQSHAIHPASRARPARRHRQSASLFEALCRAASSWSGYS